MDWVRQPHVLFYYLGNRSPPDSAMLSAPHAPSPHFEHRGGADEGVDAAADGDDGRCSMVTAASTRTTSTTSTACRPVTCDLESRACWSVILFHWSSVKIPTN
jgi:hypothetical protein